MTPGSGLQQLQKMQQDALARTRGQQAAGFWRQRKTEEQAAKARAQLDAARRAAFHAAEAQAVELRRRHAAGLIGDEGFRAGLQKLKVQDSAGTWWTVGARSGQWYRAEGGTWRADRPPHLAVGAAAADSVRAEPRAGHPFLAVLAFFALAAVFAVAGLLTGAFVANAIDNGPPAFIAMFAIWGIGLLYALRKASRIWRG